MVVAMVSVLSVKAQGTTQLPEAQMHSTSVMVGSGSSLPMAATDGVNTTYDYASTNHHGGPRRIGGGNSGGGSGPTKPDDPWATPIGDALWPLALLACAYLIIRVVRARKRA